MPTDGLFQPIEETGSGLHGWNRSYTLGSKDARFAIGGQRGRAFVSLSGKACARLSNDHWLSLATLMESMYDGRITRWDGAVDDFQGNHSVNDALDLYDCGLFNSGGNQPRLVQVGNWKAPDGRGRTLNIGMRKNGRLLRIYEKGKQLGDPTSEWVRWELELHSRDRTIPWDVLTNPGPYVAGACEATRWIHEESSRIPTYRNEAKISYDHLTDHCRKAYGPFLDVMMAVEGSEEAVLKKLRRPGVPKRLEIPRPFESGETIRRAVKDDE